MTVTSGLFGLNHSNRDFSVRESWGKNQFNSSFPAALACFMHSSALDANYLCMIQGKFSISSLAIKDVLGVDPSSDDIYFAFESSYTRYQSLVIGRLPRTDVVVSSYADTSKQFRALEVKLTALPDSTTSDFDEDKYGSELVVRPDTIFYLCAQLYSENTSLVENVFLENTFAVTDWTDGEEVLSLLNNIREVLKLISRNKESLQSPLLLHPIWKTKGLEPRLADNCLDLFVWSTLGFLDFLIENGDPRGGKVMERPMRTLVWVYKVLEELVKNQKTDFGLIIDRYTYNKKNDKAFAAGGVTTQKYMGCANLTSPRIPKSELKKIILGGGEKMLSPERRFDAILVNSPEIFA